MVEVKWIRIVTDIFDDEKIKIIDRMPARDEILVIWFKLLVLAGKVNENGLLFMSNKIPYTTDMLAAIFNREEKSIQLALKTFLNFGMITIEENEVIAISNWEKHQNIDGLDKIREQNRRRVALHRERKKQLLECNVTSNVTVTQCNAIDKELDIDKDIEKEKDIYTQIFEYYLSLDLIQHKKLTPAIKKAIDKAKKENGYTIEEMKNLLKRHKEVTETTKNNEYPVKVRSLKEFFGQKIQGATALICTQYEEGGKYYGRYKTDSGENKTPVYDFSKYTG